MMLPNLIVQRASPATVWLQGAKRRRAVSCSCFSSRDRKAFLRTEFNFDSTPAKYDSTCPVVIWWLCRRACSWLSPCCSCACRDVCPCLVQPWKSLPVSVIWRLESARTPRCAHEAEPSHLGPRRKFLRCLLKRPQLEQDARGKSQPRRSRCTNVNIAHGKNQINNIQTSGDFFRYSRFLQFVRNRVSCA